MPPARILITRPAADADLLARALEARGHAPLAAPLLEIIPVPHAAEKLAASARQTPPRAILLTSRHAIPSLAALPHPLPCCAVGASTAQAAREAGFEILLEAPDIAHLLPLLHSLPDKGPLLYPRGAHITHAFPQENMTVLECIVYEAKASATLPPAIAAGLQRQEIGLALFFSVRSARIFMQLAEQAGLSEALSHIQTLGFSAAVAEALSEAPWKSINACAEPRLEKMLDTVDKLLPRQ